MGGAPSFEYKRKGIRLDRVITVAIIGMALCVILFPLLVRAKSRLGDSSCAANLRQIGHAISLYSADHDERFPAGVDASDKHLPGLWDAQPKLAAKVKKLPLLQVPLSAYASSPDIFHCPQDSGGMVMENTFGQSGLTTFITAPSMYANYGSSYLFRTEIMFRSLSQKGYWPPANVAMLFDGYGHWHGGTQPLRDTMDFRQGNSLVNTYRYNVLYGDNHIRSLDFYELRGSWNVRL
jgi:hypothetical protein